MRETIGFVLVGVAIGWGVSTFVSWIVEVVKERDHLRTILGLYPVATQHKDEQEEK